MARALKTDPINQFEVNLKCTVCQNILTDPRTLPCCHSFCKNCLEGIVEKCRGEAPRDQPIREFPCPNCQATFTLDPDKHVADMRNLFTSNMIKATAILDRGTGVPCSNNCSQSYSVARCVTCEKFLCRECLTAHNNYRGHKRHSVLTMEELSKPENRKKINDKMYCNEHSGMELKVFCETCDKLICRDCMDFKHVKQRHSCVLVKDEANKYKEILASNNKAMVDALTEGNAFLQRLMLTTEQLDRDAENIRIQIAQKKDTVLKTVTEMLEEKTKTLLKEVDDIRKAERAKVDKQAEETKLYVEKIKSSVQLSKKLVDQGTEEEIVSSQKMMLDNANNLLTNRKKYLKAPVPVAKLHYSSSTDKEPINEEILRGLVNSLGEVCKKKKDTVAKRVITTPQKMKRQSLNVNFLHAEGSPEMTTQEVEKIAEVKTPPKVTTPDVVGTTNTENPPETETKQERKQIEERTNFEGVPLKCVDQVFSMVTATVNHVLLNTGTQYFWSDIFNIMQKTCGVQWQPSAYGVMISGSLSQIAKAGEILELNWRKQCQKFQPTNVDQYDFESS